MKYITIFIFVITIYSDVQSQEMSSFMHELEKNVKEKYTSEILAISLDKGLWSKDKSLVVSAIQGKEKAFVYAILYNNQKYTYVDINFMGHVRGEFSWAGIDEDDKIEALPLEINKYKESYVVIIRKRAWIDGQRYTQTRPVIVNEDGYYIQQ